MNEIALRMDRHVKERLVGATILVALIVIVVPALLSGPHRTSEPPGTDDLAQRRRVVLNVQTSKTTPTVAPGEPRTGPEAANGSSAASGTTASNADARTSDSSSLNAAPGAGARTQAARAAEPAAVTTSSGRPSGASAATAAPLEMAPSAPNSWSVQVGSFASRPNAERLVQKLKSSGASAYVLTRGSGAKVRYRVRVGPLADRAAAERTVTRLKAAGHAAAVVAPGAVG